MVGKFNSGSPALGLCRPRYGSIGRDIEDLIIKRLREARY